ncbi:MAG TPA: transcriptional regulator, partial [Candidatus Eisenbacteria bacterium]|nr:transcriptional regulator [Candidatus Eisenbacteria bacterium]
IRGLIHSDGCRMTNWTEKTVGGARKRYEYPRYFFSNRSEDILGLYTWALDLLGIAWRGNGRWSVSVARREAVAALDEFVGPKY